MIWYDMIWYNTMRNDPGTGNNILGEIQSREMLRCKYEN